MLAPAPVEASQQLEGAPQRVFSHTAPTPPSTPAPISSIEGATADSTRPGETGVTFSKSQEAPDSILSEADASEDEVFSSKTGSKVPTPVVPPFEAGPPLPSPSASKMATLELSSPVEIIPAPISASSLLPPPPVPDLPVHTPAPAAPNPFAFDPGPLPPAPPDGGRGAMEPSAPDADARSSPPVAGTGAPSRVLLYALCAYAAIATIVAVYALFIRSTEKPDPGHPLSTIPDTFGEFDPAMRKKVSQLNLNFDAPLPVAQRATLGQKLAIGQIEIEPLSVEKRPLQIIKEYRVKDRKIETGRKGHTTRFDALVLHLRVKNTSSHLGIHPLDPAFTRSAKMHDRPAMRLEIGGQTLYGGAISWPFEEGLKREYESAQSEDYLALGPGETREYVVFTNEDSNISSAVKKAIGPLVWRVQLRRGVIEYRGKEVPVTAIIGIEFSPSDVRNLD